MASLQEIQEFINKSIIDFDRSIPELQRTLYSKLNDEIRKLDLNPDGTIETSVDNIRLLGTVKGQLDAIILNKDYTDQVSNFINAFQQVSILQAGYWKQVEAKFKPTALLDEIKKQSVNATLNSLTDSGVSANISEAITDVLQSNIGAGGSIKQLEGQLKTMLTNGPAEDGLLLKYTRQITTDSLNQYSANYTKIVSDDLGFEWYGYRGSDIKTSRPFCLAMTQTPGLRYFHVSQVPNLLKAVDLYYTDQKTGKKTKVPLYQKTHLPQGMPAGENVQNFFILRGGYNCGHQIGPVSQSLVPEDIKQTVYATLDYIQWKKTRPTDKKIR